MKIGCFCAGFNSLREIANYLRTLGHEVDDFFFYGLASQLAKDHDLLVVVLYAPFLSNLPGLILGDLQRAIEVDPEIKIILITDVIHALMNEP